MLHLLTHIIYGSKLLYYSAGAVDATVADYASLSAFDRIMVAGGSASILNVIFAIILAIVLLKAKNTKPMMRLFLIQLMGMQAVQGIGYFLIGGLFAVGDWGNVYDKISDMPGLVTALRIILSVLGAAGIVALFFFLNYTSYYFIENKDDKAERRYVALRLHLIVFIVCKRNFPTLLVTLAYTRLLLHLHLFLLSIFFVPFSYFIHSRDIIQTASRV